MNRIARKAAAAIVSFLLLPAAAYSQAAITGVVRDTSGGVLPGVTVEAASPVLIEKVRSVVSDETGQYRIVDLQSAKVQQTVSKEVLAAIPTSRTASGIQALIPGLNTGANSGGVTGGAE